MRTFLVVTSLLILGLVRESSVAAQTGLTTVRFIVDGEPRWAGLWVPADYAPGKTWPLIVYLHGGSGRGDSADSRAVQEWLTSLEMAKAIQEHPERFPALVLMPRLAAGAYWTAVLPGSWAPESVTKRSSDTTGGVASVPAWVFHGDADTTVPVDNARKMVAAIQGAGGLLDWPIPGEYTRGESIDVPDQRHSQLGGRHATVVGSRA